MPNTQLSERRKDLSIIYTSILWYLLCIHAAADVSTRTVTASAEREDGSTPGARVTWSTTVPPECVASVTVEFRTSISGSVVRSYTTNTSVTEVIQTGLQCATTYYIRVVVTGVDSIGRLISNQEQVLVGGKVTACVACSCCDQILSLCCLGAG